MGATKLKKCDLPDYVKYELQVIQILVVESATLLNVYFSC
jgi:hypothetical protein